MQDLAGQRKNEPAAAAAERDSALPDEVADLYERHFDFVWRNARRLGVPDAALDDVVQDVFVVVCRSLAAFERRSSVQTWLFGILANIVTRQRRTALRRRARLPPGDAEEIAEVPALGQPSPHDLNVERQAAELLYELLSTLTEDKRTAFILVELEQRAPLEVAEATGLNVNTIHGRVRAARLQIEAGIARHHAREKWRTA